MRLHVIDCPVDVDDVAKKVRFEPFGKPRAWGYRLTTLEALDQRELLQLAVLARVKASVLPSINFAVRSSRADPGVLPELEGLVAFEPQQGPPLCTTKVVVRRALYSAELNALAVLLTLKGEELRTRDSRPAAPKPTGRAAYSGGVKFPPIPDPPTAGIRFGASDITDRLAVLRKYLVDCSAATRDDDPSAGLDDFIADFESGLNGAAERDRKGRSLRDDAWRSLALYVGKPQSDGGPPRFDSDDKLRAALGALDMKAERSAWHLLEKGLSLQLLHEHKAKRAERRAWLHLSTIHFGERMPRDFFVALLAYREPPVPPPGLDCLVEGDRWWSGQLGLEAARKNWKDDYQAFQKLMAEHVRR